MHCSPFVEIDRIQKGEPKKEQDKEKYLDLFATKNLQLKERVLIPSKQYPRVNQSILPSIVCKINLYSSALLLSNLSRSKLFFFGGGGVKLG